MQGRPYLPLRDYALLGDMHTAALVARDGAVDWYCLPRFDGPAALCRLLDAQRGGFFRVGPTGRFHACRRYMGDTSVLATDFETARGRVRLTDFMPLPGEGGHAGSPLLLRRVEGLAGHVELEVELEPGFDFARAPAQVEVGGRWAVARGAGQALGLASPVPLKRGPQGSLVARFRVRAGERRWVALTSGGAEPVSAPTAEEAEATLLRTLRWWERWGRQGRYPGPYGTLLRRSAITLKLLSYAPSGALVAAPTSSLPEVPGGMRNWDYRYSWLRDSAWIVDVLTGLGFHGEAMAFLGWLERLGLDRHPPAVLYRIDGTPAGDEKDLKHLEGYGGARPVRVGNRAASQVQLDIYGELMAAIWLCSELVEEMRPLSPGLRRTVRALADEVAGRWNEPDRSLWEERPHPRHYLASKLMCWVALDRALRLAIRDRLPGALDRWQHARDQLRAVVETRGYDERVGAFTHALGEPALDAAALLIPITGFLPGSDARVRSTVARIQGRLAVGPLVRRYVHGDELPGQEGAFPACSFWLVDALALDERLDEAHELFSQVAGYANDVGLLSEQIDPGTGQLLGNFPQGLTHLALVRAGLTLERVEERLARGEAARSSWHPEYVG
jgi:GH15 family glucan-1,4-alpha-glucosidase